MRQDGAVTVIQFPDRSRPSASSAQPPLPNVVPSWTWADWWDREVRAALRRYGPRVKPRHRPFVAKVMELRLELLCDLADQVQPAIEQAPIPWADQ